MLGRSGEMEVFVRAVESRSFSAAARMLALSPSAVSKLISRLEVRLGVRLINRTTRALALTAEGEAYYRDCVAILADMEDAERRLTAGAAPRGPVRVNASVPVGARFIVPFVPGFLARHPGVTVDITLTDTVVDLLSERADIAVRVGPLTDSGLTGRKLIESGCLVVAAPSYLARCGTPSVPDDLRHHDCLDFNFRRGEGGWPFLVEGQPRRIRVTGSATAGDGETLRAFALAGVGVARLAEFHVAADIAARRLVPVLESFDANDREPVHAVFLGGKSMPSRVRAFIDYLVERLGSGNDPPSRTINRSRR